MTNIKFNTNGFLIDLHTLNEIQLKIIEELTFSEILKKNDNAVFININDFYNLDSFYQRSLGFLLFYEGFIKIVFNDVVGITHDNSKLSFELYNEITSNGDGHKIDAKVQNIFVKHYSGEEELITKEIFEVQQLINKYNALSGIDKKNAPMNS